MIPLNQLPREALQELQLRHKVAAMDLEKTAREKRCKLERKMDRHANAWQKHEALQHKHNEALAVLHELQNAKSIPAIVEAQEMHVANYKLDVQTSAKRLALVSPVELRFELWAVEDLEAAAARRQDAIAEIELLLTNG